MGGRMQEFVATKYCETILHTNHFLTVLNYMRVDKNNLVAYMMVLVEHGLHFSRSLFPFQKTDCEASGSRKTKFVFTSNFRFDVKFEWGGGGSVS